MATQFPIVIGPFVAGSDTDPLSSPNHPEQHELIGTALDEINDGLGTDLAAVDAALASIGIDLAALTAAIAGKLAKASNLADLTSAADARTNLGLGSLATQSGTFSGTSSGTNTGDQTSIVGITGTLAEFNAALTGADFATGGGTATGTNTGDQTITLTGGVTGGGTGTFPATVVTNANLTGPITSVGNATAVASQTGTGSTFVMSASPTLTGAPLAPTAAPGTNTTQLATTAFVVDAVATAVVGLWDFKGTTDCSANPNYPAASQGDIYAVSVAGRIGGASGVVVSAGDFYLATADNAGGTQAAVGASWLVLEGNIPGITAVGVAFMTLANPGAVSFPRINGDNTVTALSAAAFRTAIGAGTGNVSAAVNFADGAMVVGDGIGVSVKHVANFVVNSTTGVTISSASVAGSYLAQFNNTSTAANAVALRGYAGNVTTEVTIGVQGETDSTNNASYGVQAIRGGSDNAGLHAEAIDLPHMTEPATPPASTARVYVKSADGRLYFKMADGTVVGPLAAGTGNGTVTSFSAGTASPLFTTSVATATTTPALSFTVSNANAATALRGPTSGAAAAPTYRAKSAADVVLAECVAGDVVNFSLSVTAAASALTIAVKTAAGTDATANDPIRMLFRDATATSGLPIERTIVAASSLVLSSGSTLGFTSAVPGKVWFVLLDDAGTLRIGAVNCVTQVAGAGAGREVTEIHRLRPNSLMSSTAEGGAGAADSAGVVYTGTGVTSKPMLVLGYAEWTNPTAGTWATPDSVVLYARGMPLPGDVIQEKRTTSGAVATGTTTIPADDTIPQNTEGTEFLTRAITPTSGANVLEIDSKCMATASATTATTAGLFQDTTANALDTDGMNIAAVGGFFKNHIVYSMLALTTSETTLKVRIGGASASTITFNGSGGIRYFGGTYRSHLLVREIMG